MAFIQSDARRTINASKLPPVTACIRNLPGHAGKKVAQISTCRVRSIKNAAAEIARLSGLTDRVRAGASGSDINSHAVNRIVKACRKFNARSSLELVWN